MNSTDIWVFHPEASGPSYRGMLRYHKFAKNMKSCGYNFSIFTSSKLRNSNQNLIKDTEKNLFKEIYDDSVKYYFIKTKSYKSSNKERVKNWISYFNNVVRVSSEMIKNGQRPDCIIGSSPHPLSMVAAIIIGKRFGIPVINEVRDFYPEVIFLNGKVKEKSLFGKVMLFGEKLIYRLSNQLIFLKEGDFNYIIEKKWDYSSGGSINLDKINYINNGVDISKFNIMKEIKLDDKDINSKKFKCVYTGSLGLVNNIDNILDCAKLLSANDDIVFLIYGDGENRDKLENRILDENINNVVIKGYVENKFIPKILSNASVNILNYSNKYSWNRGNSSNKIFEYMASGKPIISTVKMGYSFINKYQIGIELNENTPEELAESILKIKNMDNSDYQKMCDNAIVASNDFDYKKLSKDLDNVIQKLI